MIMFINYCICHDVLSVGDDDDDDDDAFRRLGSVCYLEEVFSTERWNS